MLGFGFLTFLFFLDLAVSCSVLYERLTTSEPCTMSGALRFKELPLGCENERPALLPLSLDFSGIDFLVSSFCDSLMLLLLLSSMHLE